MGSAEAGIQSYVFGADGPMKPSTEEKTPEQHTGRYSSDNFVASRKRVVSLNRRDCQWVRSRFDVPMQPQTHRIY